MHAYNEGCEIKFDHMPLVMCIYLMLFFERTTQDSARFIDIEEKYKVTALKGHSQEKRKRNRKQNSPGCIGTSIRET